MKPPRCRPIMMGNASIWAILNGTKTQTRRLVKPQPVVDPDNWQFESIDWLPYHEDYPDGTWVHWRMVRPGEYEPVPLRCRYGERGARLWVKEAYALAGGKVWYQAAADAPPRAAVESAPRFWRSPMFMRREYARITLEVVDYWIERVHDISLADIAAEGIDLSDLALPVVPPPLHPTDAQLCVARRRFAAHWDRINPRYPLASNPYVWVVQFERVKP
jgi:hypothetical protein